MATISVSLRFGDQGAASHNVSFTVPDVGAINCFHFVRTAAATTALLMAKLADDYAEHGATAKSVQ